MYLPYQLLLALLSPLPMLGWLFLHRQAFIFGPLRQDFVWLNSPSTLDISQALSNWANSFSAGNNGYFLNVSSYLFSGQAEWVRVAAPKTLAAAAAIAGSYLLWREARKEGSPRVGGLLAGLWLACPFHLYGVYYGSGSEYPLLAFLVLASLYASQVARGAFTLAPAIICAVFPGLVFWPLALALSAGGQTARWRWALALVTPAVLLIHAALGKFVFLTGPFRLPFLADANTRFAALLNGLLTSSEGGIYLTFSLWRWLAMASLLCLFAVKIRQAMPIRMPSPGRALILFARPMLAVVCLLPALLSATHPVPYLALLPWALVFWGAARYAPKIPSRYFAVAATSLAVAGTCLSVYCASEFGRYYGSSSAHYHEGAEALKAETLAATSPILLAIESDNPWRSAHLHLLREAAIFYGAKPDAILLYEGKMVEAWWRAFPGTRAYKVQFDEHQFSLDKIDSPH